jgi:tetratricopeptide (TPR) repeat protein
VGIKGWFRGGGAEPAGSELTLEDLIVLERYAEAEERLKAKVKTHPDDLHAHLKLAEVYTALAQVGNAIDQYVFVADEYAQDGFYDKGIALLAKAQRLAPADESLRFRIHAFQQAKGLDHKRAAAVDGLRQGLAGTADLGSRLLALQRMWHNLAACAVVQRLPPDQVTRVFAGFELVSMSAGEILAREGEARPELLLILSGVVQAGVQNAGASGSALRAFAGGDILGERALLERRPWPADYLVTEAAVLLRLDRSGLERLLVGNPDPRRVLDVLRDQGHDAEIEGIVKRMRAS